MCELLGCATMAFVAILRRKADLELAVFDGGMLARGSKEAIAVLAAELERGPGRVRRPPQSVFDWLGALGVVAGVAGTHETYFKMSAESLKALRDANGGQLPTGWFPGVTRGKSIQKHLNIKRVKGTPQQALSLQTAAIGLALRTAIAEVLEAVERVEGKVDEVTRLVRSERLGTVIGDRRTLSHLVDRVIRMGTISETDWSSIASMGPSIVRDIEALRAHVRLSLDHDVKASTGSRLDAAEAVLDTSRVRESLELLLVAEENHNMWQLLRLAHVRQTERSHFAASVDDARAAIALDDAADQALVASLGTLLSGLLEPGGTEGLAVLQAPRLRTKATELSDTLTWFADQRLLEREASPAPQWPGFKDSTEHVVRNAVTGAGALAGAVRNATRRRRPDPTPPTDQPTLTEHSDPPRSPPPELGQPDD
jgi:hypothetical protein